MSEAMAHLLVVDDDERIRGLLQKFLIRNGFLVTVARDAAQAVADKAQAGAAKKAGSSQTNFKMYFSSDADTFSLLCLLIL